MKKLLTLADCPVPCLQNEKELQDLLEIVEKLNPKKIIEIGTFYGGTLWFFIQASKNLETFTVIDLPIPPTDERHQDMMSSRAQWLSWIKDGQEIHDKIGNSRQPEIIASVFRENPDCDIDLLHIDGDHTYEGVKADYENYKNLVRPGGLIVFHDVVNIPEVNRFWIELESSIEDSECKKLIFSNEPDSWGIGIILC